MTEIIKASKKEVRNFGVTFCVIGILAAAYFAWRQNDIWPWFAGAGSLFLATGLFGYSILRPVYIAWMKFAYLLAWINTRILLGLFFYLVLTPIGLILRLTGKDLLDEKIDRSAHTYWKKREPYVIQEERYERLF